MINPRKLFLGLILSASSAFFFILLKPCILQELTSQSSQEIYSCATLAINTSTILLGIICLLGLAVILLSFFKEEEKGN